MDHGYKNPLSVTSQFSFCGLPFRMDTYLGCSFNCSFCFARLRGGKQPLQKLQASDSKFVIQRFKNALRYPDKTTGIVSQYIRKKMPVHFGGMSDPFQHAEKRFKVSYQILKYLVEIEYPIVISTRSMLVASEPYISVLRDAKNLVVQFSFSTFNEGVARIIEPQTCGPKTLSDTVEKLSNAGINTTIRWQPFIPGCSESAEYFVQRAASLGVKHLGFEHLKFPLERDNNFRHRIKKASTIDLHDYYVREKSTIDGRELVLPAESKVDMIRKVKDLVNKSGSTFGCADNELQYLSDTDCCCSGVDRFSGFENWNKFQIGYAIKKSTHNKKIEFNSIIGEWRPSGSIDKHLNSTSRIRANGHFNTVFTYVKDRWENLNSPFNPTKYYNVIFKGRTDKNGMKVYEWNT